MGNILSGTSTREIATIESDSIICESGTMEDVSNSGDKEVIEEFHDTVSENDCSAKRQEQEMNEFRKELTIKREQRKEILSRHRAEKNELEKSLANETKSKLELLEKNKLLSELLKKNRIDIPEELQAYKENSDVVKSIIYMKEEVDKLKSNNNKLRFELTSSNSALQAAYSDIADLSVQNTESIKQINSLKEVITVSKTMINLREQQLNDLKNKLNEIEQSLADRETHMLSADLRQEYERQLQNIRTLRGLYEERARLAEVTRQALTRELQEQKELNQAEVKKCNDLNAKVEELENAVSVLQEAILDKNSQISSCRGETQGLKSEMEVVNKLFSQVLLGYKNKQDLDKLVDRLEENHGILTQMAERENGSEVSSALPKLLLQLVNQVEETDENKSCKISDAEESKKQEGYKQGEESRTQCTVGNTTAVEIVQNLPKVWRVLMELLSHQTIPDTNIVDKITSCYKTVETTSGSVLVPSVSQTYIRLKDLIIEKLTLIKEVNRMKHLNGHLETRLQEQERRLCLVTTELSKTWHVVGRLRRHHHQLHTHEKILKYELQQKRKLLNELKEELEYCREKWEQAREKNSQSENDWKKLRAEFSSRKIKPIATSINNSAESGYSDERPSDDSSQSNDESEYVTKPQLKCKKKIKKSFETVIDSSTDFNLAAEREDPASDLIDVADLPLDNQEPEPFEASDSCNSEHLNKNEKAYMETEDEVGDIANDSCLEEPSVAKNCENSPSLDNASKAFGYVGKQTDVLNTNNNTPEQPAYTQATIDPIKIMNSTSDQNELAKKDKKLEILEKEAFLKESQKIYGCSDQSNSTSLNLINQPSSSKQKSDDVDKFLTKLTEHTSSNECNLYKEIEQVPQNNRILVVSNPQYQPQSETENTSLFDNITQLNLATQTQKTENEITKDPDFVKASLTSPEAFVNFKEIFDNIKRQNELLSIKDQRLQNLENNTTDVLNSLARTLQKGNQIMETLEYNKTHNDQTSNESVMESDKNNLNTTEDSPEPSTSNDMDHEAIFAARDLRLKRLEEQTKSLVNKVNKTATKGVKINYKLEELHNIYGPETSRAGTPSENNEDDSHSSSHEKENEN